MALNDILVEHVAAVVSAGAGKGYLKTGKLVQQRIRKIINAAVAKDQRDAARGNPADAGLVNAILPALERKTVDAHFRRIELDAAPATFRAILEAVECAHGIRADEFDAWVFMISTCARPSEALRARWSHIDLRKRLWTNPAEQMKSLREHIVPLNEVAVAALARTSPLYSSPLNVEAEMNQIPFLMIKWPQCLHSRVRSTFRNRAERGIALLFYRSASEPRSSAPGTVLR
jgi:integrase